MLFLAGLAGAVALTPLARRVGLAIGLVDRPDGGLKIHPYPGRVLGGVQAVERGELYGAWRSPSAPSVRWLPQVSRPELRTEGM
jgi:hypothetical protein